jgi:hypothetical protein
LPDIWVSGSPVNSAKVIRRDWPVIKHRIILLNAKGGTIMNEIVQKIVRPSALQLGMILGLLLALLFIFLDPGAKADSEINTTAENVAIEGYDTVAYFTQKKAVPGSKEFTHRWKDAIWQFASAEHRNLFANNPEKFSPQYGGY